MDNVDNAFYKLYKMYITDSFSVKATDFFIVYSYKYSGLTLIRLRLRRTPGWWEQFRFPSHYFPLMLRTSLNAYYSWIIRTIFLQIYQVESQLISSKRNFVWFCCWDIKKFSARIIKKKKIFYQQKHKSFRICLWP